jgi:hypothetical protein
MIINGFLVVRLPSENQVVPVPSEPVLPSVNGIFYAGIDRCAWCDVYDEAYYADKAPPEVASIADRMQDDCVDFSGIELARDFDVTRVLLEYSNRTAVRNEIIAIRSEQLDEIKGTFDTQIPIEWLGIDVKAFGEWSLIAEGLFAAPENFQPWIRRINENGLFDTPQAASEYERAYQAAAALGHAEELAPPSAGFGILQIQVGRVGPR